MTPSVIDQQIHRLNYLLEKQVGRVNRMKSKGTHSPFTIREEMAKMFSLEDQIQQLELIIYQRYENTLEKDT